jgi:uncharacterized membrane protein YfcA
VASHVFCEAAGLIAAGSVVGGQIGGIVGRHLSRGTLRVIVVAGGIAVASLLFVKYW